MIEKKSTLEAGDEGHLIPGQQLREQSRKPTYSQG